jgi:16S rRNA (cytosine967-C5)-methyltransferase
VIAPARQAAFSALLAVEGGRSDLDTAMETARALVSDPRDVALLHEIVTGTLRWQGRLDWRVAGLTAKASSRLDPEVRVALRMAAYQIEHLDRTPASAVVDDAVALVKRAKKTSAAGLVNAVGRRLARGDGPGLPVAAPDASQDEVAEALAVVHAHPGWLVRRWLGRVAREDVERWLAFNNTAPPTTLRVNPFVAPEGRSAVAARLASAGIDTEPCAHAPLGLIVRRGSLAQVAAAAGGACHVQDEGSQLVALIAPVRPGDRVLDLCAAPGGKTLAYGWAVGADGCVVACDVRPTRVALLAATIRRGRALTARAVHVSEAGPLPFRAAFDVVVVDAPCSGLGTLRRDPDIKWRRTPDDLPTFQARQVALLHRAGAMVAPGGVLVYTTCSTEPDENADVVARFLAEATAFARRPMVVGPASEPIAPFVEADGTFRLDPVRDGLEGYFGVVLTRQTDGPSREPVVQ